MLLGRCCSGSDCATPIAEKPITLAEAGIDKHLAQRAREVAALLGLAAEENHERY
jgi:hypothetical protein